MTTTKFPTRISQIFPTNITKGLNLCESTGNVNFKDEESCKTIKKLWQRKFFLRNCFQERCFGFD